MLFWSLHILFVLVLQILISDCYKTHTFNVGTILFRDIDIARDCWSKEEIALLNSRRIMQELIPTNILNAETDGYIPALLEYFQLCIKNIWKESRGRARHLLLMALVDVFGGYLHVYALPFTKERYYAGLVRSEYAEKLYELYEDLKTFLMTNGGNWRKPKKDFEVKVSAQPLSVSAPYKSDNVCSRLLFESKNCNKSSQHTDQITIPLPFLDNAYEPNVIALPFKNPSMSLLSLFSPNSAFVLEYYYVVCVKCLMESHSTEETTKIFKLEFYRWLKTQVVPHLLDDKWYPAFGGVLKILKALDNEGVGRNEYATNKFYGPQLTPANTELESHYKGVNQQSSFLAYVHMSKHTFIVIIIIAVALLLTCICLGCFLRYRKFSKEACDPECPTYPQKGKGPRLLNTVVEVMYGRRNKSSSSKESTNTENMQKQDYTANRPKCPMTSPKCQPHNLAVGPKSQSRLTPSSQEAVSSNNASYVQSDYDTGTTTSSTSEGDDAGA